MLALYFRESENFIYFEAAKQNEIWEYFIASDYPIVRN